jgi:hypothetical protein
MTPTHRNVAQDDLVPTCIPYRIVSRLLHSCAHSSATRKQRLTKPDAQLLPWAEESGPFLPSAGRFGG